MEAIYLSGLHLACYRAVAEVVDLADFPLDLAGLAEADSAAEAEVASVVVELVEAGSLENE